MEDLAAELTIDILSRLPVKTIIHCKSVCKKWRNLVLDSFFVNLHLSRSPTGITFHQDIPGILKWAEIEDKVDLQHLHHDPLMSLDLNLAPIFKNSLIRLVGSVNGLIFLSGYTLPYSHDTYICNPVTREFLILPSLKQGLCGMVYGFGVSSLTGEYKVVRTFQKEIPPNENKSCKPSVLEAEVYTLGTGQWRSLGRFPYMLVGSFNGRFLNDHCHWIVCDKEDAPEKICTFDLNKETFQLFPSPPLEAIEDSSSHYQSLGVLKGCLCKSDGDNSQFTIWVMKEYGIKKSWHKEVVILITEATIRGLEWPFADPISLIKSLKDGSILLHSGWSLWKFYPASDTIEYMEGIDSSCSANNGLAYHPSFLKLQKFESERVHMF